MSKLVHCSSILVLVMYFRNSPLPPQFQHLAFTHLYKTYEGVTKFSFRHTLTLIYHLHFVHKWVEVHASIMLKGDALFLT